MTTVRFKMLEGHADLAPCKSHDDDAAYDLKSRAELDLEPGRTALVPTGLFLELPTGYEAQIRPRSGLALKHALTVLNAPGTIDAGYRGEVGVILYNAGQASFRITRGMRVAQMVIQSLPNVQLVPVNELVASSRGSGGFGSTGTH